MKKKPLFRFILSILISLLLLYYVLRHFDLDTTLLVIQQASPAYLFLSLVLLIIAYLIRGYRWMIWEKDLKYWDSFRLILIGFMGNNLFPARLGELLRAHCTAQKTGEDYGRTSALASVAIERILDGFILSGIGILGLILVPVSRVLFHSLLFVSLVFGLLTASLIIGIFFHTRIRQTVESIHKTFPGHVTKFGKEKVNYFLDGLLLIRGFGKFLNAIFLTVLIWSIEMIAYYGIANAVSFGVSIETCFIFLAVVNFASLFPFTVGGIGAIEGAATMFLMSAGIPNNQALAMVIIQHLFQFSFTTMTGGIFYFIGEYYTIPIFQRNIPVQKESESQPQNDIDVVRATHTQVQELSTALNIAERRHRILNLSIVIPAYNEHRRLPKTVLETLDWCTRLMMPYELVIVDDGSSDDTQILARLFAEHVRDIRYIACPHLGKGSAVRMGMLNALGRHVLFMDADGATPLDEIPKLLARLEEGVDVAIGSRVAQMSHETRVITSFHRKIIGRIFAALVNVFATPGFADTQCGFKMFRQDVIKAIFSRQKLNGFAFDVEILYIAKKLGLSIVEVPVNWENQEGSKVNIMTDSMRMLADILRIRWLHKNEKWRK